MTAGEAEQTLKVERSQNLSMQDCTRNVGGIAGEQLDTAVGKVFFDVIPVFAFGEFVRRVLDEDVHQMLARRGDGGIDGARQSDFENRLGAGPAIFGVIKSALDVIKRGADVNRPMMMRPDAARWQACELRRLGKSEIDFGR